MTEDTVEVPTEAAETALLELDAAIRRTGGEDGAHHNDPLAEVRRRVDEYVDQNGADDPEDLLRAVRHIIKDVANERGVESDPAVDPLTDATFQARASFRDALGVAGEQEGDEDDS